MPGEKEDIESDLLKDLTGHEDDGGIPDDHDDEVDPPDDKDDQRSDDKDDDVDDDDSDLPEDLRDKDERRRDPEPKDKQDKQDKTDTTVVADIYDPKVKLEERNGALYHNGKLIANAGRERRNFEGARKVIGNERVANRKLAGRLTELADAAKGLYGRYTELEKNKNMFEKADLTFDEQKLMFDVAVAYKKSPMDGLKLMLTKAKLAGVDLAQLGVNGGGLDVTAIVKEMKDHVDERLKPVNDMTTERAEDAEVAKQVEGFFDRNPEAEAYAEKLKGGAKALGAILLNARNIDKQAGRTPLKLDEYWQKLHYQLLKQGNGTSDTRVVTDKRGERRPNNRRDEPRRRSRATTGDESFADIGKSVLADIRNLS